MKRYALLIDVEKCNQCYACALACKDEHFGSDFLPVTLGIQELGESWLELDISERGSGSWTRVSCRPELCRHCEQPECAKNSASVTKRDDGIVLIDPEKAKGDKALTEACPFGAIKWNSERGLPQKCTLCAHLLDAGESMPRCVEACPTGCLVFGDLNDPESEAARIISKHPELLEQGGIVKYYNVPGRFIAGSIYLSESETAAGASVTLTENGKITHTAVANCFGDFRFQNLPEGASYELRITLEGRKPLTMELNTATDLCFEELLLDKA